MAAVDELYAQWRAMPDAARTIALCHALRGAQRTDLAHEVGDYAARNLWNQAPALVAAARMYEGVGWLADAQALLVSAGKLAPRDPAVFLALGEVLLRRGDARRAEKVLERAAQFGGDATRLLARARTLGPVQDRDGEMAVADRMARLDAEDVPEPTESVGDVDTLIRDRDPVFRRASRVPQGPARNDPPSLRGPTLRLRPPSLLDEAEAPPSSLPLPAAPPVRAAAAPGAVRAPGPLSPRTAPLDGLPSSGRLPVPLAPPSVHGRTGVVPEAEPSGHLPFFGPEHFRAAVSPEPPPVVGPAPAPFAPARPFAPPAAPGLPDAHVPVVPAPEPDVPSPEDVLAALETAGLFERHAGFGAPAWDRPAREARRRGPLVVWLVSLVAVVGATALGYRTIAERRARDRVAAEQIVLEVEEALRTADRGTFEPVEKRLAHAFELDSRSPSAARAWLRERVVRALLEGGEGIAFQDALARAESLGVPEAELAAGRIASFLVQHDTAGAVAALARADAVASRDATYQLVAGATLERAGDPRARDRYAAALALDPRLALAEILWVRESVLEANAGDALERARSFSAGAPGRADGSALVALASVASGQAEVSEADATVLATRAGELCAPLAAVPAVIEALNARDAAAVTKAIRRALAHADVPSLSTWVGRIAFARGDEASARAAALQAIGQSPAYAPGRLLAAQIALEQGHVADALAATADLGLEQPEVAVLVAAAAYETLDVARLDQALAAVPAAARSDARLKTAEAARDLLAARGGKITPAAIAALAAQPGPLARVVALDVALETGELDVARKLAADPGARPSPSLRVRLARLARYEDRLDDAARESALAIEAGLVTPRSLAERALVLAAQDKPAEVGALFKAWPTASPALARQLRAYALAAHGKPDDAARVLGPEARPDDDAPLPVRLWAAMAFAAAKDAKRGRPALEPLLAAGYPSPDAVAAAKRLGVGVPPRR